MKGCGWIALFIAAGLAGPGAWAREMRIEASDTEDAKRRPTEKAAYLGVATLPVGETLGSQLKLPRGVGLVVDYVDPDSPANGLIERHDVLHKLGEQLLVGHEQLAVLVRMRKPGEAVSVHLMREGKPMRVEVELGEKELPALEGQLRRPRFHFRPPVIRPLDPGLKDRIF
jgi:hypothetical protein